MKNIVDFDTIRDIDIEPIDVESATNGKLLPYGVDITNKELGCLIKVSSESEIDNLLLNISNKIREFDNDVVSTEGIKYWGVKIKDFILWIMKQIDKLLLFLEKIYIEAKIIISKLLNRSSKVLNNTFDLIIFNGSFFEEAKVNCYNLFSVNGDMHANIDYILNNLERHITDSLSICYNVLNNPYTSNVLPKFNYSSISEFNYISKGKGYTVNDTEIYTRDLLFMEEYIYENTITKKDMEGILNRLDDYYRGIIRIKKIYNNIKYKNKKIVSEITEIDNPLVLNRIKLYGSILPNGYLSMYTEMGKNLGWVIKRLISLNPTSMGELRAIIGGIS